MSVKITWTSGTLEFDTLISEGVSESTMVTTSPVEKGFAISDGVTPQPAQLRIEAIISDRNIKGSTDATRLQAGKAEAGRRQLKKLMASGSLLTIETDSRLYENFVLKGLDSPREGKPDTIQFSMSFIEVRLVETQVQAAPAAKRSTKRAPEAKPKDVGGKSQGIKETDESLIVKGLNLIKGAFK